MSNTVVYDKCSGNGIITVNVSGSGSFAFNDNGYPVPSQFPAAAGSHAITITDRLGFTVNLTTFVAAQQPFDVNSTSWSMSSPPPSS